MIEFMSGSMLLLILILPVVYYNEVKAPSRASLILDGRINFFGDGTTITTTNKLSAI